MRTFPINPTAAERYKLSVANKKLIAQLKFLDDQRVYQIEPSFPWLKVSAVITLVLLISHFI